MSKKVMLPTLLAITVGLALNGLKTVRGVLSGAEPNLARTTQVTDRSDEKKVKEAFDKLPIYFIESQGGSDSQVAYHVEGKDKSLYFTPQGIIFTLENAPEAVNESRTARLARVSDDEGAASEEEGQPERDIEAQRWIVKLDFLGANPQAQVSGRQQTPAQISYFTGSKSEWRTGLKTYSSIIYRDLWPGIDLVYSGTATQMKHEFIVRPGGDPRDIKLAWRGASSVKLNEAGQLEISTPVSSFTDDKPYSFQEAEGKRTEVKTAYQLEPEEEEGVQVYGFAVGEYDRDQTLVIDPAMIIYCGYIGGGRDEMGRDVAVDGSGYAYVTGVTWSDTSTNPSLGKFPATVGPDKTFNGGNDAFVAKIRADGRELVYCGYIGGSAGEYGNGIAVDNLGRAYVTGVTNSTNFPVSGGPDLTHNGGNDAFVARVNAAGTALEYCGYIGGSDFDSGSEIAVDSDYNAYIVGSTGSSNFPRVVGPDLTYNAGFSDVFVTKIKGSSAAILYSGFIGGAGTDNGYGVAVDSAGNAYVTGYTESNEQSFPVRNGPDLTYNLDGDAFVARVRATGAQLDYCGYIGGDGQDAGNGIAVNSQGDAYICGSTASSQSTFPLVVGPSLIFGGDVDAFVARLKSSGTGLIYCGYLGGTDLDAAEGIALDSAGQAYVTGFTQSADFPVFRGPDSSYNGDGDAFIAGVDKFGRLFYSSYLGGSGSDYAFGIAVVPGPFQIPYGAPVIIVGRTNSLSGFPLDTGPSKTFGGAGGPLGLGDAFVARIDP